MSNPMSLEGRVILVTGAGQGIGREVSEMALSLGAKIVAVDRNEDAIKTLADANAGNILPLAGDITDEAFVADMVAKGVAKFGAIHGLVNNAGITRPSMIKNMSLADWEAVIRVNQTGAFLCLKAVGMQMLEQSKAGMKEPGSIVNVSSNAGRKGSIGQINYSAAKSAMLGMTVSATNEWAQFGIRTNSVCFGTIETQMTETIRGDKFRDKILAKIPMGRWGSVDEAAKPIIFFLSSASSFVTGQQLSIDGGAFLSV